MRAFRILSLAVLVSMAAGADGLAQSKGLRIVVLEGEDGVNIIQQKSAVQPVVEVRDQNDLPVAGASVVFLIGGGGNATFASGVTQLTVVTDAAGRAAITGLQPVSNGAYSIQVTASAQGQTATATISQSNFASVAEAAQAGKVPGSQSGSSASSGGSGAGSGAGAGAGAGGGLSGAAIGGIAAGAAAGGLVAVKAASGGDDSTVSTPTTPIAPAPPPTTPAPPPTTPTPPPTTPTPPPTTPTPPPVTPACTSQLAALEASSNQLTAVILQCATATTDACFNNWGPAFNTYFTTLNNLCSCLGTSITAEQRASFRAAFEAYQELGRLIGFSTPPIPACFT